MRYLSLILAPLMLFNIVITNMTFTNHLVNNINKWEEERLNMAVNYASDAAVEEMRRESTNLDQDYKTISYFVVDPQVAANVFSEMICKNYGVPVNKTSIQTILLDYVPAILINSYDGYYLVKSEVINDSGVSNVIVYPKMPYSKRNITNNSFYSFNLDNNDYLKLNSNLTYDRVASAKSGELSKLNQKVSVNDKVSTVMNQMIMEELVYSPLEAKQIKYMNGDVKGFIKLYYKMQRIMGTNPVNSLSILAYVNNFELHGRGDNLQCFAIGGSELSQSSLYIGFLKGGRKYYSTSKNIPNGVNKIGTFTSALDAAKEGYYYYQGE